VAAEVEANAAGGIPPLDRIARAAPQRDSVEPLLEATVKLAG